MTTYLDATPEAGKAFYQKFHQKGSITMLNLLRFKAKADYSELRGLRPDAEISGREAYTMYLQCIAPLLNKAGSEILFSGAGSDFVIGPENESWDMILLVRHASVSAFLEFARSNEYLRYAGHRTAGLEDSRLLPIIADPVAGSVS